ncbi:hypothetical protein TSUD_227920 [Trifolium subterraneum]|uniref:Uncharacterized protein n=1 Tax=Trifolium subterraneum TaxID=3900 RepID=A0A2Z6LTZ6_TRISU|nr:hypothetical protein TSUD_227920 [Trifolium subterraneum]
MARPPPKNPPPPRLPGEKFAIITLDQIFDADFARKYCSPSKPVDFEKDPNLLDMLIKCATLAILDYNTQHHTDYRFVKIEMATFQLASSAIFHVSWASPGAGLGFRSHAVTAVVLCVVAVIDVCYV